MTLWSLPTRVDRAGSVMLLHAITALNCHGLDRCLAVAASTLCGLPLKYMDGTCRGLLLLVLVRVVALGGRGLICT